MAKVVGKGTVLEQDISSTLTAVAQIISIDLPEAEVETVEADTLDNADAGIPYEQTGRVEGGSLGLEMYFDPALAGHQEFTDKLNDPLTNLPDDYNIEFADAATTAWPFTAAGISLGGSIAVNDLVKAKVSIKLDKTVTYPT